MPFMQIKNKIKMGLKKGRGLFSQSSAVGTSLKSLREKISRRREQIVITAHTLLLMALLSILDCLSHNIPLLVVRIPILKGTIM